MNCQETSTHSFFSPYSTSSCNCLAKKKYCIKSYTQRKIKRVLGISEEKLKLFVLRDFLRLLTCLHSFNPRQTTWKWRSLAYCSSARRVHVDGQVDFLTPLIRICWYLFFECTSLWMCACVCLHVFLTAIYSVGWLTVNFFCFCCWFGWMFPGLPRYLSLCQAIWELSKRKTLRGTTSRKNM